MSWLSDLTIPVSFRPKRKIGSFQATITLEEVSTDDLEITQHPVQEGAAITDHAYMKPAQLAIRAQWSPTYIGTPIDELYRKLRDLQSSKIPFDVVTGKRIYKNMLIKSLAETTDRDTSSILNVSMQLQEIIITQVTVTTVPPRANQKDPGRTGATENAGQKKVVAEPESSKRKSALQGLFGG